MTKTIIIIIIIQSIKRTAKVDPLKKEKRSLRLCSTRLILIQDIRSSQHKAGSQYFRLSLFVDTFCWLAKIKVDNVH